MLGAERLEEAKGSPMKTLWHLGLGAFVLVAAPDFAHAGC
jgi:hypothetical protein